MLYPVLVIVFPLPFCESTTCRGSCVGVSSVPDWRVHARVFCRCAAITTTVNGTTKKPRRLFAIAAIICLLFCCDRVRIVSLFDETQLAYFEEVLAQVCTFVTIFIRNGAGLSVQRVLSCARQMCHLQHPACGLSAVSKLVHVLAGHCLCFFRTPFLAWGLATSSVSCVLRRQLADGGRIFVSLFF